MMRYSLEVLEGLLGPGLPIAANPPLRSPVSYLLGQPSARMQAAVENIHDGDSEFSAGVRAPHWFDRLFPYQKNEVIRICFAAIENTTNGDPRDAWLRMVFAAHDGWARGADRAYELILDWSKRGAGWTNPEAVERAWASAGGRAGGVTVGTLIRRAQEEGADLTAFVNNATASPNALPSQAVSLTLPSNMTSALSSPFTTAGARRLRHVFGDLMARGVVSLFGGKTKTGKTAFLVAASLSIATGRPFLGHSVLGRPLRVLLVNSEEPRELLLMRFRAAMIEHHITELQVAPRLTVITSETLAGLRLTKTDKGTESVDPAGMQMFEAMVTGYDVVILDPLMAFLGSSVNTNEVMAAVMLDINRIARLKDAAILVSHHTKKGAGFDVDGSDAFTGASALMNHCRVAFGVVAMTEAEAPKLGVMPPDAWRYVTLIALGNNYAPPASGRDWLEKVGVPIPGTAEPPDYPDDDVSVAVRVAALNGPAGLVTDQMRHAAVQAIHRAAVGKPLSDSNTGDRRAVPIIADTLAPHLGALSAHHREQVAKAVLGDLMQMGWVRVDPEARIPKSGGKGSNKGRALYVEWALTPWQPLDQSAASHGVASTSTTLTPPKRDEVDAAGVRRSPLQGAPKRALGGMGGVQVGLDAALAQATHGGPMDVSGASPSPITLMQQTNHPFTEDRT